MRVVFGLGTGRCGTQSLSFLLNNQDGFDVSHELFRLSWKVDEKKFSLLTKRIKEYGHRNDVTGRKVKVVGDVAFWYLPYVEYFLKEFPEAKFICLRRNILHVVRSFLLKVKKSNHWTHPAFFWNKKWKMSTTPFKNNFDLCFPKYFLPKVNAIYQYCEDYYYESERLEKEYPNNFKTFDVSALSFETGQRKILNFIGIPFSQMIVFPQIIMNRGDCFKRFLKERGEEE